MLRCTIVLLVFCSFVVKASVTLTTDTLKADSAKQGRILPGPVFNYSPETNFVFGLSALYTFYSEKRDNVTRPSFLFGTVIYSLNRQFIGDIYLNTWSKRNRYHYLFEISYFKFNYYYYGIGNNTRLSDQIQLNQKKTEVKLVVEKKLVRHIYLGWELNYKDDRYPSQEIRNIRELTPASQASGGEFFRAGVSLIFDSRNSYTYAMRGHYLKLTHSRTLPFFKEFDFRKLSFESRSFFTFQATHTVGINTNFESIQGHYPFFENIPLGGPFIMRGYYQGRFRDQNLLAGQVEYRWKFLERLAVVGFAGTGAVFGGQELNKSELKPNYGLGLRYFYDITSGVTLRLDYGIGEKIPGEGRVGNFYFFVNEAF
jgi:outer membrane translocation and assembly module TamA